MEFGTSVQKQRIKDIEIAFRQNNNLGKPSIMLLHGMAETSAFFWDNLVHQLENDYHIIAVDLLGHGDSDKPLLGYGPREQAELYIGLLDGLGIEKVAVIGHSLGGIIGCQIAVDFPDRVSKLILYDSPIPRGPMGNLQLLSHVNIVAVLMVSSLAIPGVGLFLDYIIPHWLRKILIQSVLMAWRVPFAKHNFTKEFAEQAVRNSYFALEQSIRDLFLFNNLEEHLPKITAPTLMMLGEKDSLLSVKRAKTLVTQHLAHSELQIIKQAGHVSLIDQPDVFMKHLVRFLEK